MLQIKPGALTCKACTTALQVITQASLRDFKLIFKCLSHPWKGVANSSAWEDMWYCGSNPGIQVQGCTKSD